MVDHAGSKLSQPSRSARWRRARRSSSSSSSRLIMVGLTCSCWRCRVGPPSARWEPAGPWC